MKIVRNVLLGIICISLVVGGYYLFSSRQAKEDETDVSEVQKVILDRKSTRLNSSHRL